ncbi:P2X purinoceptor 7-like [Gadus chalcogrammus]|uniref:P2X purinoceptor 7-like n=1 Tax=Gadus chalcogrammus TaxID=1042646 RepID=UPI0024C4D4E2|nr:P2X purinoceptor 7-like [Gadus chalcogrammus]
MAESNTDFNQTNILFDFDGSPYLYEPEYTEEELQEQDERSRRMGEQPAEEVEEDHSRRAGIFWCACGYCEPMGTEAECFCCQECDLFRRALDAMHIETRCVTAMEDFPSLVNRAVLETFFRVPKINWKRRPIPEGPDGQLSNNQCRLVAYRVVLEWALRGERLGRRERRVLPSCVLKAIRKKYPSLSGEYQGFKEAEDIHRIF